MNPNRDVFLPPIDLDRMSGMPSSLLEGYCARSAVREYASPGGATLPGLTASELEHVVRSPFPCARRQPN